MNCSPAFQFYAADWLADADVTMMTLEEEGAYIRALAFCWREGSIPADDKRLSTLLKGASTDVLSAIKPRFKINPSDPQRLVHCRLDSERKKQQEWRDKSSEAGKKSGMSRRIKKLNDEPPLDFGSDLVEPKTNSSSLSSSSNKNSITKKEEIEKIYEAYPRHTAKDPALKAIEKALKKKSFEELLAIVQVYATNTEKQISEGKLEKQYIPHPSTWFNQGRYEDDDLKLPPQYDIVEVSPEKWWNKEMVNVS